MKRRLSVTVALVFSLTLIALAIGSATTGAVAPSNGAFQNTWARTDKPVLDGQVARTWIWGPEANTGSMQEDYAQSPNHKREVQYYDKSRMELNNPSGDPSSPFYVTNGLLVVELMTGKLQTGDDSFEQRTPANINVAGDFDDPTGPTYLTFAGLRSRPALSGGSVTIQRVDRNGNVTDDGSLASYGVTAAYRVQVPNIDHQVASPFWDFMNSSGLVYQNGAYSNAPLFQNPFYATGYPVTEAYWANVLVGGTPRLVLMQCFERRCLTYTPGNPPGFVTEAGNVGLHYYAWRYPSNGTPTATSTATATATATEEPAPKFRVYVTDLLQHRVQVFSLDGEYLFSFGQLGNGDGEFESPAGVAVDQTNGWVYVADSGNDRVERFDLDGHYLSQFGGTGNTPGKFENPLGIAVDAGGFIYVADTGNNRVQKLNSTGGLAIEWGSAGDLPGQFNAPVAIAVSSQNVAFVVDQLNHRVQAFDATNGQYLRLWGGFGTDATNYQFPSGIALDHINEDVFVTSTQQDHVLHTDQNGNFVYQFGRSGDATDQFGFNKPTGIAIDPNIVTEDQRVYNVAYVVDSENDRVMIYTSDFGVPLGQIGSTGADPGQFTQPAGVAVYHPYVIPPN